jgi:cytochrome d ubiquinol oxidase subunit II
VMLADIHAAIILGTLILYALLGGADFGSGVWHLFATGPRRMRQRETIERAIAPVWEANHVWLIMAIVLAFTAFPRAFAIVMTTLSAPTMLLLLGIVFRGSAFVIQQYGRGDAASRRRWGGVFASASMITPVFLGIIAGAITAGRIQPGAYLTSWLAPFPILVGVFTLSLFATLAAVYLTVEAHDPDLQNDFRIRATIAQLVTGVLGLTVYLTVEGPVATALRHSWWSAPLVIATAACAAGMLACLWRRRFHLARALVILEAVGTLVGWGAAMLPFAVPPNLTIHDAAAPASTLRVLLGVIIGGAVVVVPVFFYLLHVFKLASRARPQEPRAP